MLSLLRFICTVEKRRYIGTSGCMRIITEVYLPTHRECHVLACPAFSPLGCWELLRDTPPGQTMVGEGTLSYVENRQWRHYTNPYIIIVRRYAKITQRGIRRFCMANGPCKLRTGFHEIVRVVIIFFSHCYPRTHTYIGGYVLNQQRIYSSPADDDISLRWNMRDKSKFLFTSVFSLHIDSSLRQGCPTWGNKLLNQPFKLTDI